MRKLASVRKIIDIFPIDGADSIECAVVDGWEVVVKKNEYKIGDYCIYFEIDSVLPIKEQFEFLRKNSFVKKDWLISPSNLQGEGFRLKTIKLRGQLSQGLLIKLEDMFEEVVYDSNNIIVNSNDLSFSDVLEEGYDLTDIIGVVKWDPPLPSSLSGTVSGNFPSFIPKTDQTRIQNIRDFWKYKSHLYEVSIKLDGSSMTVYHNNGIVGVCSRNFEMDYISDTSAFSNEFIACGLDKILPDFGNISLQGELMGPSIQGNRESLRENKFYLFDVFDIDNQRYFSSKERMDLFEDIVREQIKRDYKTIGHCPILSDEMSIDDMDVKQILKFAEGPSIKHPVREGLVFKSINDPNFSFKAISNLYLLSEK